MENKNSSGFLAYRSFYTTMNTIEKFAQAGYDTVCVFPAHTLNSLGTPYSQYPPTWQWYDKIDFYPFDRMVEDTTRAMPDAKLLLMIDLNSPAWLEHNVLESVCDTFMNLGKAVHNPVWLEATENYLKSFVKYANEKYGDRIAAYIIACGSTDEWYDYSKGTDNSDRRRAWRKYQIGKGKPDPIDIPPESVRDHVTFDNFLRDPEIDGIAIDYWHFCNDSIADTIIRFANDVREIIKDNADIGCFYGYILEKTSNLVSCGHLAYERVFDCPNINFVISPGTYVDRHIGGGSGFLVPNGTAEVRGKKLLHECDQRTHTYNPYIDSYKALKSPHWETESETVAGIKREAALGMINRTNLWWFDMWGDFYKGERVMNTLRDVKKLWGNVTAEPKRNTSEVCMIVDTESTYYINQLDKKTSKMNLETRNKLSRLGAPYDVYTFSDIPLIKDFERYKLVIFTSLFEITSEKQKILKEYVLKDGRSILWLYAPGIVAEGKLSSDNCEKLSGIPYGADGIQKKKMEGFISYYIHNYDDLTPAVLKKTAKEAGVTINVEQEIPVYAEGNIIAIHTKEGGNITVTVDQKYSFAKELYTGNCQEIKNGKFVYEFSSPDTALFCLE